jgi:mono/diheme cytochrome c family protein
VRLKHGSAILGLLARCLALAAMFLAFVAGADRACAQDLRRGGQNYTAFCARCHGAAGTDTPSPQFGVKAHSFTDCSWMKMMSDATLFGIIRNGGRWAGMRDMPAVAPSVSDREIREIIAFLRTFCAQGPL